MLLMLGEGLLLLLVQQHWEQVQMPGRQKAAAEAAGLC
jgi:hypothetical protein